MKLASFLDVKNSLHWWKIKFFLNLLTANPTCVQKKNLFSILSFDLKFRVYLFVYVIFPSFLGKKIPSFAIFYRKLDGKPPLYELGNVFPWNLFCTFLIDLFDCCFNKMVKIFRLRPWKCLVLKIFVGSGRHEINVLFNLLYSMMINGLLMYKTP